MEAFYLRKYPRRLFTVLHLPAHSAKTGLVFCPPFGEEMACTYAPLARWAKELAERGYAVLRYHPYGTGDSDGSFSELTLESACADAAAAVSCLRERAHVERVGLFGLRFGGSLAVHAANVTTADFLLLWSPIVDLRRYFHDLLRLRLTGELVRQQSNRPRVTTETMIKELEDGRSVDILGYELSAALYRQMAANSAWPSESPAPEALWLTQPTEKSLTMTIVEAWESRGSHVDVEFIPEGAFWRDFYVESPHKFITASYKWLGRGAPRRVSAQ